MPIPEFEPIRGAGQLDSVVEIGRPSARLIVGVDQREEQSQHGKTGISIRDEIARWRDVAHSRSASRGPQDESTQFTGRG